MVGGAGEACLGGGVAVSIDQCDVGVAGTPPGKLGHSSTPIISAYNNGCVGIPVISGGSGGGTVLDPSSF